MTCSPSRENDAFSPSVIEAMSTGLPVVTTPMGAIPEIIRDRQIGLWVPPGNPTALEQRLGLSAWQTVQDLCSAELGTQRYAGLSAGLVGERPLQEVGRQ